jgi:leucyl aminopeptidase
MKCDMAGGAAVLSDALIADLKLPIKVTAIVPCTENSVSSKSFTSDVISYSGHSIEIIDTDAEDVWFWLMEYRIYLRTITRLFN